MVIENFEELSKRIKQIRQRYPGRRIAYVVGDLIGSGITRGDLEGVDADFFVISDNTPDKKLLGDDIIVVKEDPNLVDKVLDEVDLLIISPVKKPFHQEIRDLWLQKDPDEGSFVFTGDTFWRKFSLLAFEDVLSCDPPDDREFERIIDVIYNGEEIPVKIKEKSTKIPIKKV